MSTLLLLPILLPLAMALLVALPQTRNLAIKSAFLAPLGGAVVLFTCKPFTTLWLPDVLMGTLLRLDPTAQLFLLLSTGVWFLAGLFALRESYNWGFWFFFLLTLSGNLGLCLAGDGVSFYLLFALMTFGAYPLVIAKHNHEALRAGKVYLVMALLGEGAILVGMMVLFGAVGDHGFDALFMQELPSWGVWFLALGFGVKVGVVGLHSWLPLAHSIAPAPASAVLSGVMLKAGLLGWMRFLPLGWMRLEELGLVLVSLGMVGIFGAVIVGFTQKEAKSVLAYSSVSQMGVVCVAIGVALMIPAAWEGIRTGLMLYILHHGFVKAGLFFAAGIALHHRLGATNAILTFFLGLSLCGAPLASGAVAKGALKAGLGQSGMEFGWVLMAGAVFSTLLVAHFLRLVSSVPHERTSEPNLSLAACAVASALVAGYGFRVLGLENIVPILVGVVVFWGLKKYAFPVIPKGDILALLPKFEFHPSIKTHLSTPLHVNLEPLKQRWLSAEAFLAVLENSITVWVGVACGAIGLMFFF
ncbi:hypothetical protein JWV37_05730 [Sulfurospirillum sp. T05]|uniref:NADH:quinone oxidoreductase/Mrp antiporter transmembrane domain-containing protein n=1 Tax=Sulfurospirillum tamanense TaxID=2813362 RepID=A0ABS2WRK8_9BACT|nr:proton-conducting transporter membrane subunit [Sulfurospirillum tamanensis]MBN2964270.1 hypothetical protein [Sulfurospirillum tamanensis]